MRLLSYRSSVALLAGMLLTGACAEPECEDEAGQPAACSATKCYAYNGVAFREAPCSGCICHDVTGSVVPCQQGECYSPVEPGHMVAFCGEGG
jgi:hypothetical protein